MISWTAVISAYSDNVEPAIGLRYFIELLSEDVELNEFTFTTILRHSISIKLGFQGHLQALQATIMKRLSEMEANATVRQLEIESAEIRAEIEFNYTIQSLPTPTEYVAFKQAVVRLIFYLGG